LKRKGRGRDKGVEEGKGVKEGKGGEEGKVKVNIDLYSASS